MKKKALIKLGGFIAAAAATASLVGFAANGTGAYFSDSHSGTLNVSTGNVRVTVGNTALDFTGALPGKYVTQPVSYTATGSGLEDVYIEFNDVDAFQEVPTDGTTPLGRYGHLEVQGPNGDFSSYNLATDPGPTLSPPQPLDTADCHVDQYGRIDGNPQPAYDPNAAYCPAPKFILVSYGIQNSNGLQTANITFGFTPKLDNTAELSSAVGLIPFKVVAVEHDIDPNDPLNGLS